MGCRSDVRKIAAVTIQRWYGRRREVSQAVRLLSVLHIMRMEREASEVLESLHRLAAVGINCSGEQVVALRGVEVLIDVATFYAKRLHSDNYKRQISSDGEAKGGPHQERHRAHQRYALLPETVVANVISAAVSSFSRRCDNSVLCDKTSSVASRMITCWGTTGNILLARVVEKCSTTADCSRSLLGYLKCVIRITKVTLKCSASSKGAPVVPLAREDELGMSDIPPLPKPPAVPEGRPLDAAPVGDAEVGDIPEAAAEEIIDASAAAVTGNTRTDEDSDSATSSSSSENRDIDRQIEDDEDGDGDGEYSDDKYYRDKKKREEARMARIVARLGMGDAAVRAAKTSRDAVVAEAVAASKQREREAAEEHEAYMELFGDVEQVLYPALMRMKRNTGLAGRSKNTAEAGSLTKDREEPPCCVVCELYGGPEELLACTCGNRIHRECGSTSLDGILYCSKFCGIQA